MEIWHSEALLATTATLKARKPGNDIEVPINDEFTPNLHNFLSPDVFFLTTRYRSQFLTTRSGKKTYTPLMRQS